MFNYIIRRLILLPITLFFIVLVNFIIVNLAPGDPVTVSEVSQTGASKREDRSVAFGSDDRYLQFREFYGLTLPILFNAWTYTSNEYVQNMLHTIAYKKEQMNFKEYDSLRINFGDRSRFIMPKLLAIMENQSEDENIRKLALRFFIRGGTMQAYVGPNLTDEQKAYNRKISDENVFLSSMMISSTDNTATLNENVQKLRQWYEKNASYYDFEPTSSEKLFTFFFETRFFRYMSRVVRLDFGTLRNDPNKTVVSEVTRRFKYSLTLAILPMVITFFLCQFFGFIMALNQNRWPDYSLNIFFLILYAIPIFVAAPFLIENVALNHTFPFTDTPVPYSGFSSPDRIYDSETSHEKVIDILQHIFLPLVAIMYGTLAAQTRLSRTSILEVLHQDYVRTARAKGLAPSSIMVKHVGRNAAITIVTSLAGSLGIVLGGSLIIEILFQINGFGKFFYDAVINRDYNVIMFSALAGSFLTLIGYLVADIAYTVLDPRVTLD